MEGKPLSLWVFLLLLPLAWGEIGPRDCVRFQLIISAHPQIFGSPKNSIIAENCLPGNDSTEWDVNADGDPSIQVDCSLLHLFYLIVQFLFRVLLQDSV